MKYALFILLLLTGCDSKEEVERKIHEAKQQNTENLRKPDVIGILPDGQTLQRVIVANTGQYPHYVYFVGSVVTVSSEVSNGKYTHLETTVNINGKNMPLTQAQTELASMEVQFHEKELARLRAQPKEQK